MNGSVRLGPGTIIGGDYVIQRPLAEGGMGAVYVAEQRSTGKLRALKIMHPQLVPDAKSRERFAEEARIGARIPSEHVVDVVGAGVDPATGVPWLAMELLEGEELESIVRREGGIPWASVRELFLQVGHALGAAHERGIVHRDLKPENLFVARSKRTGASLTVKILDFGIAKTVQESRTGVTSTSPIGSPLFMAPEQGTPGAQLSPATDVWALGLIAFHALTGRYYWRAANMESFGMQALFAEVLVHPIEPASHRAAQLGVADRLPPSFDAWFARCVSREPGARFPNARLAVDALVPLLSSRSASGASPFAATMAAVPTQPLSSAAGTVGLPLAQPMPLASPARRGAGPLVVVIALTAGAILLGGALTVALLVSSSPSDVPPPVAGAQPAPPPQMPAVPAPPAPMAPLEPRAPEPPPDPAPLEPRAPEPSPEPAPRPASTGDTGTLTINTRPWSQVFVDGRLIGTTPIMRTELPAGRHSILLVNTAEDLRVTRAVQIVAGEETRMVVDLASSAGAEPAPPAPSPGLPQTPSRGDIVSAMQSVSGPVRACSNGEHGVAPVRFTFAGSTGRVTSAEVTGDSLSPTVRACVARAARGAHVPPFAQPSFSVNYPFRL